MKRVLFYCQHTLGMGHLIRSMEIVRGLKDFEVCFLNGGEIIEGFEFPSTVKIVNLPPIKADEEFKAIQVVNGKEDLDEIKSLRTKQLLSVYEHFNPDVVIIELFPFGRKKFAFELVPLLTRIRLEGKSVKVVCSLRDILVSKLNQARHEARVCELLNRYFDLVLIHADPQFQRLEETFFRMNDIEVSIKYTGYVVQSPPPPPDKMEENAVLLSQTNVPLILASIGGGRVGYELLQCAMGASSVLEKTFPHRMLIFAGPYIPDEQFSQLQEMAKIRPRVTLERYSSHFLSHMEKAELSISMAGYNTCMNILTTGTKALVFPFTGNQNNEQTIRSEKLEALGIVRVIRPNELHPQQLAKKIKHCLTKTFSPSALDLHGVENTVAVLDEIFKEEGSPPTPMNKVFIKTKDRVSPSILESGLRPCLEKLEEEGKDINIFLRDDDIDEDEETLRHLFDISLACGVPLNVEIIPGNLKDAAIGLLKEQKRFYPRLIEFNQHGWKHLNHENEGRKCEFGASRTFEQQFEDISRGKAQIEEIFDESFYPVFTPPWNRCTEDTFKVLDQLGFKVFSKDRGDQLVTGFGFREISTTLDLYRWKGVPAMKSPEEIVEKLIAQMGVIDPIGILLHHKVMGDAEFRFLYLLLSLFRKHSNVRFHTFQSLMESSIAN